MSTVRKPNASVSPARPDFVRGGEVVCRWGRWVGVSVGLAIGLSNLLTWIIGGERVVAVLHTWVVMRFNTALAISMASISLALWGEREVSPSRRHWAQACAVVPLLIGLLTSFQDLTQWNLGIDQLFVAGTFVGDWAGSFTSSPGRMSLNAALSLAFLGASLFTLGWEGRHRLVSPIFASAASLPSTLGLVGYLVGLGNFTGLLRSTNILLHTAVALYALALGVLLSRPDRPPVRMILSPGADGVLLRWLLPGSLTVFLGLAWMIEQLRGHGLLLPREGAAIMLYGGLVLLSLLMLAASSAVARQEASAQEAALAVVAGEQRNRATIDAALDGVVMIDIAGRVLEWNPAAQRIFGWSREEMIGTALEERIVPQPLRAAHLRGLAQYRETGKGIVLGKRLELTSVRRDGREFPVELSINPLPQAGEVYFVAFIRDISERRAGEESLRRAKEEAEAASRAKDHFLAALSHELRTPLAPVLMSAGSLKEDRRLPEEARAELAMIERHVALEARLIDDLLDLTRITRGKLALRSEHCDLHEIVRHAVGIVQEDALAKGVTIEMELKAAQCGLEGDATRLQQLFWNLLKNAVKFTPAGGFVRVATLDRDGLIRAEVIDTGIGFDAAEAERLFEPFEQVERPSQHRFGGLGLGLAIARAIAVLHGGTIHARSEGVGLGASFSVELPGAIDRPVPVPIASHTPDLEHHSRSLGLLVVEDHQATLAVLVRLLQRAGHRVVTASSVAGAIQAAAEYPIEVLISDLGLPDGSGHDLMRRLRETQPGLRGVALSGYGMEDDQARSREAGFSSHLVKPIDFDQLRRVLKELAG